MDLLKYDEIIEPAAGEGAFSSKILNCRAYDIVPNEQKHIQEADWLKLDKSQFSHNSLVIGNPPFGE